MKNKNIEYCVYCGTKNKIENKRCTKCNKKLNPKDRPLLEYIKSKIKDELKDTIEDNIIDIITKYIKSHLYGFILSCSIIITTTCVITNIVENNYIQNVTEKPAIVQSAINICVFENSISPSNRCNEGYTLEDNICKKEVEIAAISNNICPNNHYQNGNRCISNMTYNKLTKEECLLPNDGAISVSVAETGECVATYCTDWQDGVCSAGNATEIDYTVTEYCPDGTIMIENTCRSTSNIITEYTCEEGTLNNDKCIVEQTEEPIIGCEDGYLLNEECNLCVLEIQS